MDSNFAVFFYSCAGKKAHVEINNWFTQFLKLPYLDKGDRGLLEYTLECAAVGAYPPWDYYSRYYSVVPDHKYNIGELGVAFRRVVEYYQRQRLVRQLMEVASTTDDSAGMVAKLREVLADSDGGSDDAELIERLTCWSYSDELKRPLVEGVKLGVPEIDDLTNGFRGGSVATIAGFTGSGKTISVLSTLYKAASKGKKCVYVSLELPVKDVWLMLEARFMYEAHGIRLNYTELLHHKLSGDKQSKVLSFEDDWKSTVAKNICIVDESFFPKEVFMDVESIRQRWALFEKVLGGLDLICLDHVGQLQLLYQERGVGLGNAIIVKLRQSIMTYLNGSGELPALIFACQTNREGYDRACRHKGLYDLRAISDLNEVERSSAYVVFIFTEATASETQECQYCMIKHRYGAPLPTTVVAPFLPAVVTVGDTVESITLSDEFAGMDGMEFGGGSGDLGSVINIDF